MATGKLNGPGLRAQLAGDDAEQRGLSAAVGANDAQALAIVDDEGEIYEKVPACDGMGQG
ncbi:MAG: hypothetical protein U5Q44_04940 [Dehalococcoidia bacterium]|nr:hypothetical protein [Dehalococcoidia bacterium]